MQIRCKFGQLGQGRGQFNAPHGFCLGGRDEEIVVADTHNHRIQVNTGLNIYKRNSLGYQWGQYHPCTKEVGN